MKSMTDVLFTGGGKKNLMTGGSFLTYSQEAQGSIVFLCHVPSLRSYNPDEAKQGLEKVAWMAAVEAAKEIDPDGKKDLSVGLRGIASYGSVTSGKAGDKEPSRTTDSEDESVFYPAFAPQATVESH
jgi:hypothetical protein